jgi:hypothetical protein
MILKFFYIQTALAKLLKEYEIQFMNKVAYQNLLLFKFIYLGGIKLIQTDFNNDDDS